MKVYRASEVSGMGGEGRTRSGLEGKDEGAAGIAVPRRHFVECTAAFNGVCRAVFVGQAAPLASFH